MTSPTEVAAHEMGLRGLSAVDDLSTMLGVDKDAPLDGASESPTPAEGTTTDPVVDAPEPESPDGDAPEPDAVDPTPDALDGEPESPAPDADPFAEFVSAGKPFTYTVDGQARTFAGIVEVEGKGGFIPSDQLGRLRDQFSLASKSIEDNKALYAQTQEFARVGGLAKLEEVTRNYARQDAAGEVLVSLLKDPNALASLLVQKADGTLAFHPDHHRLLLDRMDVAAGRAEMQARTQWETTRTTATAEANAPTERQAALTEAIATLGKDLTEADREAAFRHFAQFGEVLVRKATAEDVAKWPQFRVGQTLVDAPKMQAWFEDRRARVVATPAKRTEAARHNAAVKSAPKPLPPRRRDGTFKPEPTAPRAKPTRHDLMMAARRGDDITEKYGDTVNTR